RLCDARAATGASDRPRGWDTASQTLHVTSCHLRSRALGRRPGARGRPARTQPLPGSSGEHDDIDAVARAATSRVVIWPLSWMRAWTRHLPHTDPRPLPAQAIRAALSK